jgi:glutamate racemase
MNNYPIGIIDSGSGGLSLYQSIKEILPMESIHYIGDHANIPYGSRTEEFIRERIIRIIKYLRSRNIKLIVVACNTATVAGIDYYRTQYPGIPIIGIVPVVKTAANISKKKKIVIFSTEFTSQSQYQKNLIKTYASDCHVISLGSNTLVPLIEQGNPDTQEIQKELQNTIGMLDKDSYDVIVLGCSHYPFVRSLIRAIVGSRVTILDSADAVARQVQRVIQKMKIEATITSSEDHFETTGDANTVTRVCTKLLQKRIQVTHVNI